MPHLNMPHLVPPAASVLSTAAAHADLGDQLFKLLPDDGAAEDFFGTSVAISGATAIVEHLDVSCRDGDLVVIMGAGPVWQVARDFLGQA